MLIGPMATDDNTETGQNQLFRVQGRGSPQIIRPVRLGNIAFLCTFCALYGLFLLFLYSANRFVAQTDQVYPAYMLEIWTTLIEFFVLILAALACIGFWRRIYGRPYTRDIQSPAAPKPAYFLYFKQSALLHAPSLRFAAVSIAAGFCAYASMTVIVTIGMYMLDHGSATVLDAVPAMPSNGLLRSMPVWLAIPVFSLIPAVAEELFFRGALLPIYRRALKWPCAVILASACFALMHGDWVRMPIPFLLGLVAGTAAVCTRSLYNAIIVHAVHNACVLWLPLHNPAYLLFRAYRNIGIYVRLAGICLLALLGLILLLRYTMRVYRRQEASSGNDDLPPGGTDIPADGPVQSAPIIPTPALSGLRDFWPLVPIVVWLIFTH